MLIAHATDLSGDDEAAFLHASALAAASGARLVSVHGDEPATRETRLPDASELAARWGRPIAHERRRLGAAADDADTVPDAVLGALRALRPALVVLGTHGRHGLAALLRGSVEEAIARNLDVPALVVPDHGRGFVDPATGTIALQRILIPAGDVAEATRGLAAARSLLALAGVIGARLELVHIGHDDPRLADLGVPVIREQGQLEEAILDVAHAFRDDLIVMPTRGHDGLGDVLRGSHTEHVIRQAECPVLSVPIA